MAMPDDPLTTWTLGDIEASGMKLERTCATEGRNEFARFNVGADLALRADWRVPKVLPVRCSQCGEPLLFQLAVLHEDEPDA